MSDVVRAIQDDAEKQAEASHRHWRVQLWTSYVVGVMGVAAGATAGLSAITTSVPALTAAFGFAAALAVGLQTFLNADAKARHHWVQVSEWTALARRAQRIAERGFAVPEDEISALIEAAEVQGKVTFGDATGEGTTISGPPTSPASTHQEREVSRPRARDGPGPAR